jgi:ATP-dependent DNA helicase PIF1
MDSHLQNLRRQAATGDMQAEITLADHELRASAPPFDWAAAREAAAAMTPSQRLALKKLLCEVSLSLTGDGGTGKSFLISTAVDLLRQQGRVVAVTASTGLAASLLGGQTIHSWSGCGRGAVNPERMPPRWHHGRAVMIRRTDVLFIDEASMLDARTFGKIEALCRKAKGSDRPWGGLQLVVVGDMAQLPPVQEAEFGFLFEAKTAWEAAGLTQLELREIVRQHDPKFIQALREARLGALSPESLGLLSSRVRAFDPEHARAIRLVTHRRQARKVNHAKLRTLVGSGQPSWKFTAWDRFTDPSRRRYLGSDARLPKEVTLAVGARVLFVENDRDRSWVNGSMGVVTALSEHGVEVHVDGAAAPVLVGRSTEEVCEQAVEHQAGCAGRRGCRCPVKRVLLATRYQFPLQLGWAATIHRAQGMTLDAVSVDLSEVFAPGQAYVAISRVRGLAGLNIERWRGSETFWIHPRVKAFLAGEDPARFSAPNAPQGT